MAGKHEKAAKSRAKPVREQAFAPTPGVPKRKRRWKDGTPLKVLDTETTGRLERVRQDRLKREEALLTVAKKRTKELKETPAAVSARAREIARQETEKRLARKAKRKVKPVESRVYPKPKPLTEDDIPKFLTKREPKLRGHVGVSPALAAPYGKTAPLVAADPYALAWKHVILAREDLTVAERREAARYPSQAVAEKARDEFRKAYPHLPAAWAEVAGVVGAGLESEVNRLNARVDELLRANAELHDRARGYRRERDEALRCVRIIAVAMRQHFGMFSDEKAQRLLHSARKWVLGETE